MKSSGHTRPPKWGERFLDWFCKPELVEAISGDLMEDFNDHLQQFGARRARVYYWYSLIRFLRPFAIRHITQQNNTVMLKNYLKTSSRNIARNKLFSAINIIGLAISMSVGLLMISLIYELHSYDQFHRYADRTYRIISHETYMNDSPYSIAASPLLAAKRMEEEIPGVEAYVTMNRRFVGGVKRGDKLVNLKGLWASKDFFKVFPDFNVLSGNIDSALESPNSIVLTEATALKLFRTTDVIGELIELENGTSYTVTALIENVPFNSHFTFEALGSMVTYENEKRRTSPDNAWLRWTSMGNDYIYLRLQQGIDPSVVNAELARIADEENLKSERLKIDVALQPLLSIIPGPVLSNNIGKSMDTQIIWIMLALTLIVIVSAIFNYTNLSIARSIRRMKEVGVRKVMGAARRQVFAQFMVEAVLIAVLSLLFATLIYYLAKDGFLELDQSLQQTLLLESAPLLLVCFLLFSIVVGLFAGFFPALVLSKLQVISALKGQSKSGLLKRVQLRKVLNIVQFTFSMIFIISATIAYRQYDYALNFDLGFDTDNVVNIDLQGNDADKTATALASIPGIDQVSKSYILPGIGGSDRTKVKYKDPLDSSYIAYNFVDEHYIPLLEHHLLAGKNFEAAPDQKQEQWVIVNEQLLSRFNIGSPQEAIGEIIELDGNKALTIVGVVEDFVYSDISNNIGNFGFRYAPNRFNLLNLKLSLQATPSIMDEINRVWDEVSAGQPMKASFYDLLIQQNYAQYSAIYNIVGILAFLAITIASLGLLGMAVYTTETRIKEVSIRKILGASSGQLFNLLGKSFIWILIVSAVLAIPVSYYLFDQLVLASSANRISIGVIELLSGVLIIFIIGAVTIGSQAWQASRANPAKTLRTE